MFSDNGVFSSPSSIFSFLLEIHVEPAKIQSYPSIFFSIVVPILFIDLYLFFQYHLLLFGFIFLYQIRSILILLIVIFYSFLNFFFILSLNILFHLFSIQYWFLLF
jgi:hypothetical protein